MSQNVPVKEEDETPHLYDYIATGDMVYSNPTASEESAGTTTGVELTPCAAYGINIIGGGTRGAEGATAPPDFKIYAFGPPRFPHEMLTNIGWKSF